MQRADDRQRSDERIEDLEPDAESAGVKGDGALTKPGPGSLNVNSTTRKPALAGRVGVRPVGNRAAVRDPLYAWPMAQVLIRGRGDPSTLTAYASQLFEAVRARQGLVLMTDPRALAEGDGTFVIEFPDIEQQDDAEATALTLIDQVLGSKLFAILGPPPAEETAPG